LAIRLLAAVWIAEPRAARRGAGGNGPAIDPEAVERLREQRTVARKALC
jgi:hypothetical protein